MKKVIHVGGTNYSGSTLLDMTLANDAHGFSCGEVHAMFHPFRRHHLDLRCGCADTKCPIWPQVRNVGAGDLYAELFRLVPQAEFIVDSSKPPVWIMDQTRRAKAKGIDVANVVIWKTPNEYFASRVKRGEGQGWSRAWINYYRMYFSSVSDWISVRYSDLVNDRAVLPRLCEVLRIPYFPEKHEYWRKTQHTLFGNSSAKVHLHAESSVQFRRLARESGQIHRLQGNGLTEHRRVYYRPPDITPRVSPAERTQFELIQTVLDVSDVRKHGSRHTGTTLRRAKTFIGPVHARLRRYAYRGMRTAASARVRLFQAARK